MQFHPDTVQLEGSGAGSSPSLARLGGKGYGKMTPAVGVIEAYEQELAYLHRAIIMDNSQLRGTFWLTRWYSVSNPSLEGMH